MVAALVLILCCSVLGIHAVSLHVTLNNASQSGLMFRHTTHAPNTAEYGARSVNTTNIETS